MVAKECASNAKRKNVQSYAGIDPRINVPVESFDNDSWALNTPGGIVDLRTGALLPADPGRLFTRCTSITPKQQPTPRWNQFLMEITKDDAETAAYLKRLAGYSLTGSTREHVLAFLWGPGGNGKGVFLNTLVRALGSYAAVAAMDTFTSSRFDRHPAELAALVGARLVTAQETQEDRSWDEAKVKSITGGDPITARYMRQDFFTYQPQFKLLFAGNHRPHVKNLDDAMRRRFHLVPFTAKPKVPDQVLAERLQHEWAGILQWAVEGCLEWQEQGLAPPNAVVEATENYFIDEDPVGRWMAERTQQAGLEDAGTDTQELFNDWRRWCLDQNEKPGSERIFVQALLSKGLEKWRNPTSRRRGLSGVLLKGDMESLPPPTQDGARFIH
jgi:putative DNA primase/helicase